MQVERTRCEALETFANVYRGHGRRAVTGARIHDLLQVGERSVKVPDGIVNAIDVVRKIVLNARTAWFPGDVEPVLHQNVCGADWQARYGIRHAQLLEELAMALPKVLRAFGQLVPVPIGAGVTDISPSSPRLSWAITRFTARLQDTAVLFPWEVREGRHAAADAA